MVIGDGKALQGGVGCLIIDWETKKPQLPKALAARNAQARRNCAVT